MQFLFFPAGVSSKPITLESGDRITVVLRQRGDGNGGQVSGVSVCRKGAALFATADGTRSHTVAELSKEAAKALIARIANDYDCVPGSLETQENEISSVLVWVGNK